MRGPRTSLILLVMAVAVGVLVSARLTLRAQERPGIAPKGATIRPPDRVSPGRDDHDEDTPAAVSVQDALQRPFSFPFAAPTSLTDVCQHLRQALRAPVVLDLAALDRQDVRPEDQVQLHLDGVRLKTGLKLLLDQVGLTYQVIAEDNLLILTDTHGSTDPIDRILSEVKALHRDVHDLQDAVDDILWSLGLEEDGGAKMRKPTIIEEVPGEGKPEEKPQTATPPEGTADRRRSRPGA